jgi:hypothetical protein
VAVLRLSHLGVTRSELSALADWAECAQFLASLAFRYGQLVNDLIKGVMRSSLGYELGLFLYLSVIYARRR